MKRFSYVILSLVLCLSLMGCSGKESVSATPEPTPAPTQEAVAETEKPVETPEPTEEPLPEVSASDWTEAFRSGNNAYEAEDWRLAEAYYLLAAEIGLPDSHEVWDAENNRGLALLQQGKNEEALAVYESLLERQPLEYGYWMNYLVAGHGCGITAEELLQTDEAMDILYSVTADAENDPGEYQRFLYSLYYNIVYMDMEQETLSRDTWRYAPLDDVVAGETEAYALSELSGEECAEYYTTLLQTLDETNRRIYGEADPDLEELLHYLTAKTAQSQSQSPASVQP